MKIKTYTSFKQGGVYKVHARKYSVKTLQSKPNIQHASYIDIDINNPSKGFFNRRRVKL